MNDRESMRFIGGYGDGEMHSVYLGTDDWRIDEKIELTGASVPTGSINEFQLNTDGTLRKQKVFDMKLEVINLHVYKRTAFIHNNRRHEFFVWVELPIEEAEHEIMCWIKQEPDYWYF